MPLQNQQTTQNRDNSCTSTKKCLGLTASIFNKEKCKNVTYKDLVGYQETYSEKRALGWGGEGGVRKM